MAATGTGPGSELGACAVRVSRCDSDGSGTPDYGNPHGAFVMCGGISKFAHDFEVNKGQDIFEEDSCGNPVVIKRRPDKVKQATFTLTMAKDDDRLAEITQVAVATTTAAVITGRGYQAAAGCETVAPIGCIIELWVEQVVCGEPHPTAPYRRHILPWAFLVPKGYEVANGVALPVYEGYTQPNPNLDDGPFGDLDQFAAIDNLVYMHMDDTALPVCASPLDYVALAANPS